jgi:hypothetical protein
MDRKFLMTVSAIAGATVIVALVLFPLESMSMGDKTRSIRAIQYPTGGFLLVFAWLAGGFAAMLFLKLNDRIGLSEQTCRVLSFAGFKLAGFFFLAMLIGGTNYENGWGFGYWLAFIASIVGAFAIYLTFNPALAQRIAEKAREATKSDDAPKAE